MKRKRISDIGDEGQGEGIDIVSDVTREELDMNDIDLKVLNEAKETGGPTSDSRTFHPSLGTRDQRLCDRCASIDFRNLFTKLSHKLDKPLVTLGYLGVEHEQGSCELCRLFYHVKVDCLAHAGRSAYSIACLTARYNRSRLLLPDVVLCVRCKECEDRNRFASPDGRKVICIGGVDKTKLDPIHPSVQALELKPNFVDFGKIHRWIGRCEETHRKAESCVDRIRKADFPQGLKLIDCERRRVVMAQPEFRYCALSYVWGDFEQSSPRYLRTREQLPSALPQTIEDALIVTRKLGFKYLWIDRYCINQNNSSEKHTQIGQMDLIYRNSYVTIIAAAGDNPSYGLPGVSSTPRDRQLRAFSRGLHLVSVPYDPHYAVTTSSWMTRGWTFQEAFFSARRLIFTSTHVYFECREASTFEYFPGYLSLTYKQEPLFRDVIQKVKRPWDIQAQLAEYSKRKLSFQTDAINAFEGTIHDFGRGWDATTHYWGVLIVPSLIAGPEGGRQKFNRKKTDRLFAGLCWRSRGRGTRRTHFPSWSWAGWTCEIEGYQPELGEGITCCRRPHSHLKAYVVGSDGQPKDFEDISQNDCLPEPRSKILYLTSRMMITLRIGDPSSIDDRLKPSINRVDQVFALFEDDEYVMSLDIHLLCHSRNSNSEDQTSREEHDASKFYGVLMSSGHTSGQSQDERMFFLIVEEVDRDNVYQRIGHFEVSREVRIIRKPDVAHDRKTVDWNDIPSKKRNSLLFKNGEMKGVLSLK